MEILDYSRKYKSVYKEIIFRLDEESEELIELENKEDIKIFNMIYKDEELIIECEELKMETLVEKIETVFSELCFSLDEKKDIKKLLNLEIIQNKWKKIMVTLLKENLITTEIEFIYEVLKLLESESNIKDILKDYYLFRHLFMGIYEVSSSKRVINKQKKIKNLFVGDILFDLKIEYLENEREVKVTGKEAMEYSYVDCIKKLKERKYLSKNETGEIKFLLDGKYLLNEDNSIKTASVDIRIRYHKREMGREGKILLEINHSFNIEEV